VATWPGQRHPGLTGDQVTYYAWLGEANEQRLPYELMPQNAAPAVNEEDSRAKRLRATFTFRDPSLPPWMPYSGTNKEP
jgi:hypothetical protein